MQPFTITLGRAWWSRIAGRNPLVRNADRIQAWVFILAALMAVAVIPVCGAIGNSVHDARLRFYADQAKHRHPVIATALEYSTVDVGPGPADVSFFVRASWTDAGNDHVDVVKWADKATAGDQADIWVDDITGEPVEPPAPPSRAVSDAVGVAFSVWFMVTAAIVVSAYLILLRLIHRRNVQWDRELDALIYKS